MSENFLKKPVTRFSHAQDRSSATDVASMGDGRIQNRTVRLQDDGFNAPSRISQGDRFKDSEAAVRQPLPGVVVAVNELRADVAGVSELVRAGAPGRVDGVNRWLSRSRRGPATKRGGRRSRRRAGEDGGLGVIGGSREGIRQVRFRSPRTLKRNGSTAGAWACKTRWVADEFT
jgi:hypothetical protein